MSDAKLFDLVCRLLVGITVGDIDRLIRAISKEKP